MLETTAVLSTVSASTRRSGTGKATAIRGSTRRFFKSRRYQREQLSTLITSHRTTLQDSASREVWWAARNRGPAYSFLNPAITSSSTRPNPSPS